MPVIWEWDGSLQQITSLVGPVGYTHKSSLMSLATVEGKDCLRFTAEYRGAEGGTAAPTIEIFIRDVNEFYMRSHFYLPPEGSFGATDGSRGWCTLSGGIKCILGGEPRSSGTIQLHEKIGWDSLEVKCSYYKNVDNAKANVKDTIDDPNLVIKRGKWIKWISYHKIHTSEGAFKHWFDDQKFFDKTGVCSDTRSVESSTPRVGWRNYTSNDIAFPQDIYYTNLKIQTGMFQVVEPTEPEPPGPPVYDPVCDLNNDGKINVLDLAEIGQNLCPANCYTQEFLDKCGKIVGSVSGETRFDAACDLNGDGKINVLDLAEIGKNICPTGCYSQDFLNYCSSLFGTEKEEPPEPPPKPCTFHAATTGTILHDLEPTLRTLRDKRLPPRLTKDYYLMSQYVAPKIKWLRTTTQRFFKLLLKKP